VTPIVANPTLAKLHDYYQPLPPPWTPHTIGWYVLYAIFLVSILWFVIKHLRRWLRDRYRREALRELASTRPDQLSALLKRTALAAWPREEVASLSGDSWLRFLQTTAPGDDFKDDVNCIEEIAFRPSALSTEKEQALHAFAAGWIRRHRVQP
jgi:hypothetical protein